MAKKKLVLKLGTSTLTQGTKKISAHKIKDIAKQIVSLRKKYDVVVVSSGAIATARQFVQMEGYYKYVGSKQAMAAIGQPKLMKIYDNIFERAGLKIAQCLMTYRDFQDRSSKINTKSTIEKLLQHGYVPIVNENDTVTVEEIIIGDNDKLSALVATIIDADLLVIESDTNGLYDKNPFLHKNAKLIQRVTSLKDAMVHVEDRKSRTSVGGMASKVEAARICKRKKIEMWIINGKTDRFLIKALDGRMPFTKFKF